MNYMRHDLDNEHKGYDDEPTQLQCRHIKPDGIRCGSPSLRNEPFCYYHHTARRSGPRQPQVRTATDRKSSTFDLPAPADLNDRAGVQLAIALILHKIANNEIDPRRAGLLLYGLQIASGNLKEQRPDKKYVPPQSVEELTEDPTHGLLAPEAELQEPEVRRSSSLKRLIYDLSFVHDEPKKPAQPQIAAGTPPAYPANTSSAIPANPIPSLKAQATATVPTPNRACRREALKQLHRKANQSQPSQPNLTRPRESGRSAHSRKPEVRT